MTLEFLKSKDYKKWRVEFKKRYKKRKLEIEGQPIDPSDSWSYWSNSIGTERNEEIYQKNIDWCFFYIRSKVKTSNITG